jgi:hypothetical protein
MCGFVALVLFFTSVLFAPWRLDFRPSVPGPVLETKIVYSPIFIQPKISGLENDTIVSNPIVSAVFAWQTLVFIWLAIGISYGALFFLLSKKSKNPLIKSNHEHGRN